MRSSKWVHTAEPSGQWWSDPVQSALGHHFFQIAIAERVTEIPAHTKNNDVVPEMPPSEQLRSTLTHASPNQTSSLRIICDIALFSAVPNATEPLFCFERTLMPKGARMSLVSSY